MSDEETHVEVHQEEDALPRRAVLGALGATIAFSVMLGVLAWGLLKLWEAEERPRGLFPEATMGRPGRVRPSITTCRLSLSRRARSKPEAPTIPSPTRRALSLKERRAPRGTPSISTR